ncbi:succinylglutamate desuccinylase [Corallincola spongiicola]|uniref:Succinylglutamate desuccinylase n=2 Tax=Corallincola spongiicola TaxID=2520508 RepID=A0ABY1WM94_9GAMM|nr:succinylglutamate desuccinylase [Corallincola spongiicola]
MAILRTATNRHPRSPMEQRIMSAPIRPSNDTYSPLLSRYIIPYGQRLDKATTGHSVIEFLQQCGGPTWLTIEGKDITRSRAVVTLLHGNEPSGVEALFQLLQRALSPPVTCHLFIAVVNTALTRPYFSHRHLPQHRDLNRCFNGPTDDFPGQLAREIWQALIELQPEAVVDLHNTSGSGPAFAVSVEDCAIHQAIASLFCQRMIVTDVRLGALMEKTSTQMPVVTIECGGAIDPESRQVALEGLEKFICAANVREYSRQDWDVELLHHPCRVIITPQMSLAVAEQAVSGADITLPGNIEHHNFGRVLPGTCLAWLQGNDTRAIKVLDGQGIDLTNDYFENRAGELTPKQPLKLFMITTNIRIAQSDCLFYLVAAPY